MNAQANPGITFEAAQGGYRTNAEARRQARENLRLQLRTKAEKNHDLQKLMSMQFAKHRAEGKGVEEAKILSKGDVAHVELARDLADAEAKAAQARLAELEGERASLRQLVDWTREETG